IVELLVGDQQVLENLAADDCFVDDPWHIRELHAAVPDRLRVDDNSWAQFALVEATGLIGPDRSAEPALLNFALEGAAQRFPAVGVAAPPWISRFAAVTADDNMVGERGHAYSPRNAVSCRLRK